MDIMWDTPAGIHLAVERRRERQGATGCIDADITSPPQIILQSSSPDPPPAFWPLINPSVSLSLLFEAEEPRTFTYTDRSQRCICLPRRVPALTREREREREGVSEPTRRGRQKGRKEKRAIERKRGKETPSA